MPEEESGCSWIEPGYVPCTLLKVFWRAESAVAGTRGGASKYESIPVSRNVLQLGGGEALPWKSAPAPGRRAACSSYSIISSSASVLGDDRQNHGPVVSRTNFSAAALPPRDIVFAWRTLDLIVCTLDILSFCSILGSESCKKVHSTSSMESGQLRSRSSRGWWDKKHWAG